MKDWKKSVLWTLVGFCAISVIIGIFNLFSFLQTESTDITSIGIEKTARDFYIGITVAAIACTVVAVALIVTTVIYFAKNKECDKRKFIFNSMITIIVVSAVFVVFAFCTQYVLKADTFEAFGDESGRFYYNDYYHYQTYLSAMLSTFLPLLIAGGIIFGYLIYSKKAQNSEVTEKAE